MPLRAASHTRNHIIAPATQPLTAAAAMTPQRAPTAPRSSNNHAALATNPRAPAGLTKGFESLGRNIARRPWLTIFACECWGGRGGGEASWLIREHSHSAEMPCP